MSLLRCVVVASLWAGCGESGPRPLGGPSEPFPDHYCPGSEGCTGEGDGVFRVGAARAEITPDLDAAETEWTDEDGDHKFDATEDFIDENGNDKFDAVWMAGFDNGRPATGVHSPLWVRAVVFERNDIRVGYAVVDAVGWMVDEINATRDILPAALQLDHIIVQATHLHEGPDTMGLWGEKELVPGYDLDYQQFVREQTVQAFSDAVAALEEARLTVASAKTIDESGSSLDYVSDSRDPNILDPTMTIAQFTAAAEPSRTIATLVHWAAHPEYSGSGNNLITADYVDQLREVIELGAAEEPARDLPAIEGLGGEVVFLQGALGGQIGPKFAHPIDSDGTPLSEPSLAKADALGRNLGRLALLTITDSAQAEDFAGDDLVLEVRTGAIDVAVENTYYHVAALVDVFNRQMYGYDTSIPLGDGNTPYIASRVSYLRVGPLGMMTAPGELHPELAIGGYAGEHSYGRDLVKADNENPPDLTGAPEPPYLHDILLEQEGVLYPIVLGLAEDMMGYIVPSYNFELAPNLPYIEEAPGDHYEEINSVGPLVEEHVVGAMRELVEWKK